MRPEDLPDFRNPPLNEVVLGVQFKPVPSYQQIRAGEVWALFRNEFPNVRELPPLPPFFETFGPAGLAVGQIDFQLVAGATHNRFWFLSHSGEELIQFQQDRLLHNWRKIVDNATYPRFESIIEKYEQDLVLLRNYFLSISTDDLSITQCEVSYINHILCSDQPNPVPVSNWLHFLDFGEIDPEDFSVNCRWIIPTAAGTPQGRLIGEASTAINSKGQRIIVLTLTARGAPAATDIPAALQFLKVGRELIVKRFARITTDSAHRIWERIK